MNLILNPPHRTLDPRQTDELVMPGYGACVSSELLGTIIHFVSIVTVQVIYGNRPKQDLHSEVGSKSSLFVFFLKLLSL